MRGADRLDVSSDRRAAPAGPRLRLAPTARRCCSRSASTPTLCCRPTSTRLPQRNELPRSLAQRLAGEKAAAAVKLIAYQPQLEGCYILAADTVVAVGRRILPKCEDVEQAEDCLRLLSGRQHRVFTGVTLITPRRAERRRLVETRLRFKRLAADRDRRLSRLRRMARQGGRLRHSGARRRFRGAADRLLFRRRRPAALRDRRAAGRRGLSGADALVREGVSRLRRPISAAGLQRRS